MFAQQLSTNTTNAIFFFPYVRLTVHLKRRFGIGCIGPQLTCQRDGPYPYAYISAGTRPPASRRFSTRLLEKRLRFSDRAQRPVCDWLGEWNLSQAYGIYYCECLQAPMVGTGCCS